MSKWWKRKPSRAHAVPESLSHTNLSRALGHEDTLSPTGPWLPQSSGGHDGGGHGRLSAAGQLLVKENDPLRPDAGPKWSSHRRAYRRCLRTTSTLPPLAQPALLARVLAFLPVQDALRSQAVCVAWRRLALRCDLVLWKAVTRAGTLPPAMRGAFWVAMGYQPAHGPPSQGAHNRPGYLKGADVCRWRALLTPFSPQDGPSRHTGSSSPSSAQSRARERSGVMPPRVPGDTSAPDTASPPPDVDDMGTLFERYHKCGLICEEASDGVGRWSSVLKELSQIRSKQVKMLEKAVGSGPGALSEEETILWTEMRAAEKDKEALVATIKQSSRPAVDVALATRADADICLKRVVDSTPPPPPSHTSPSANQGYDVVPRQPRRRKSSRGRGGARRSTASAGAGASRRSPRSSPRAQPGTLDAFTLAGTGGNLWCGYQVPVPARVHAAGGDDSAVPSPSWSQAGSEPGTPAPALWASPHLIIEADVIRTFGLTSPTHVSATMPAVAEAPPPPPAPAPAPDPVPPRSPTGKAMNPRERALARLRRKLAAERQAASSAHHRRRSSVHLAESSMRSAHTLAAALARDTSRSGAAVAAASAPTPLTVEQERAQLRQVLIAYSALDDGVGYCQGMNFVGALLLRHMPKEYAFWMMAVLLHRYQFASVYSPGLKRVGLCFYQLDRLLEFHLPLLHAHLSSENVSPDMYSSGWFMTMFSSMDVLPYATTCAVWDLFLVDGWKALFRVILALLEHVQDDVLGGDFPVIVQFLNTLPPDRVPPLGALFRAAHGFKVTNRLLSDMERQYFAAMEPPPPPSTPTPPPVPVASPPEEGDAVSRPRATSLESPQAKPRTAVPGSPGDGYASDSAAPRAHRQSLAEWTGAEKRGPSPFSSVSSGGGGVSSEDDGDLTPPVEGATASPAGELLLSFPSRAAPVEKPAGRRFGGGLLKKLRRKTQQP